MTDTTNWPLDIFNRIHPRVRTPGVGACYTDVEVESIRSVLENFEALTRKAERLEKALLWAKPYVARIRDTEIIDQALADSEETR